LRVHLHEAGVCAIRFFSKTVRNKTVGGKTTVIKTTVVKTT
jgi:hypothetical protein